MRLLPKMQSQGACEQTFALPLTALLAASYCSF